MTSERGQFRPVREPQTQNLPGLEEDLQQASKPTKLQGKGALREYRAAGKLSDSRALITGGEFVAAPFTTCSAIRLTWIRHASSGIGRAVAVLFAREGADVSIVYLPEEQQDAEATRDIVGKEGRKCLLIAGDLMSNDMCQKAVRKHVEIFGMIDILVNNASKQFMCEDFKDIDLDKVESTFRSNVLQMFAVTKYALPHMEKGSSINSTSTVAFRGTPGMVDYSAKKGAITSFTLSLAKQLMRQGIRVNAVAPGPVHTPLQAASRPPEQMEGLGKNTQLGRPGQPNEIAPSFVFLASKDSALLRSNSAFLSLGRLRLITNELDNYLVRVVTGTCIGININFAESCSCAPYRLYSSPPPGAPCDMSQTTIVVTEEQERIFTSLEHVSCVSGLCGK